MDDFNNKLHEPYIIVVTKMEKSTRWVRNLSIEKGLREPEAVVCLGELPYYLEEHPDIRNFAILDDAAYSGEQSGNMAGYIVYKVDNFTRKKEIALSDINLHVLIPYMSEAAEAVFNQYNTICGISICKYRIIDSISSCAVQTGLSTDKESMDFLKKATGLYDKYLHHSPEERLHKLTLTYFDHKVPDLMSFPSYVKYGVVLSEGEESKVLETVHDIFPQIVPPYYLHYEEWLSNQLGEAMAKEALTTPPTPSPDADSDGDVPRGMDKIAPSAAPEPIFERNPSAKAV